jgi:hypothetical protein
MRCKSAVFCQTERLFGIFFTRTENKDFTGFSGIDKFIQKRKGAWNGLFFPQNTDSLISGVFDGG